MPIKTKSGKWKWGNVERDSKKELVQTVYGIWKKNGSKGSFSDFLKGMHESVLNEAKANLKDKLYFHGSAFKSLYEDKTIKPPSYSRPFFVTSDIYYAIAFSGHRYGGSGRVKGRKKFIDVKKERYVYVVSLNKNAEFLDFRSNKGYNEFISFFPDGLKEILKTLPRNLQHFNVDGDPFKIGVAIQELLENLYDLKIERKVANPAADEVWKHAWIRLDENAIIDKLYKELFETKNILSELIKQSNSLQKIRNIGPHDLLAYVYKELDKKGYSGIIGIEEDTNEQSGTRVATENSIGIWNVNGLDRLTTTALPVSKLYDINKYIDIDIHSKDAKKEINQRIVDLMNAIEKESDVKESTDLPKDKFFKVKNNGKEIGKYGLSFYDDIKAVGIGDFEVYPEFRNKGYGTKIIKDIVDKYKNDYDRIYCFVDKDNKDAIRLYKRLGKVSDEVTYSQKIGDYKYINTNGQHYVEFYNKLNESFNLDASKIYFHGSLDKNIRRLNAPSWKHPFCVTTDLEYAMDYAKEFQEMFGKTISNPKEGAVYAMTINDSSLNIFDFQNNSDVNKLKGKWPSVMIEAFKSNEYGNSDPLSEITDMILSYEWQEDRPKIAAFNALKKRLESELGIKIRRWELENDSSLKYKLRFSFRNLLLKDIQDLGYDGYRASETQNNSTENAFVLINLNNIDKIIPYPIPYKKAEEAVKALYARMKSGEKMELDDEDYKREDRILRGFINELKNKKKTKTNEGYELPYSLDTIKQKYGDEAYRKLRDDPVHRFRAETGIEVIHKEPTRDEFERIVKNWDLMTPEQKKQSDEFSNKIFGNNNKNRVDLLRREYDFKVGDKVKVRKGLRCFQSGHTGKIIEIEPPDKYGWSSFVIKFDEPRLGAMGFNSGDIEKLNESTNIPKDRYFVTDLEYNKHIEPVINILKKWPRMKIKNITKYGSYADTLKWFGIYKGHSINDIVALVSIEINKKEKEIHFTQINAGEKGIGKILVNLVIDWCKKNKNGCDHITWIADPDSSEELKNYYRKNWPEAKETEEKNKYWKTSKFTLNL